VAHTVQVPAFSAFQYKVTNGEYLEYVRSGAPPHFFGWSGKVVGSAENVFRDAPAPRMPVYLTHREAESYAKWRGMDLPTEAQFHRAPAGRRFWAISTFDTGTQFPSTQPRWRGLKPVRSRLFGNGWEWTSTVFAPFPAFEPFPFYTNYSARSLIAILCFEGRVSAYGGVFPAALFPQLVRPDYPYIYATLRLV